MRALRTANPSGVPSPLVLIRVHRFGTESLRQGRFSPADAWAGRRAVLPSPPVSPSPAGRAGEGERAAPLSHAVGEGLGVRAKKRVCSPRSEPKCCTLIRGDTGGEGNTARLPAHASAGENRPCRSDSVPNRCTLISSFRFPLRAGGTEPVRGSPREAGRNLYPHSVPLAKRGEPAGGGQNPHSRTHSPTPLTQGATHAII